MAVGKPATTTRVVSAVAGWFARRPRPDRPLDEVIRRRELRIVFQPIRKLASNELVGVEALARISATPDTSPEGWFARARRAGRVVDLDLIAAEAAVAAGAPLPPDVYLAVNLTPAGLCDGRAADILAADRSVVVEITEHDVVDDYDELVAALDELRSRGVRVAVDDAGAGWSTLRHVLLVRPDIVKLDAGVTAAVVRDAGARALTRALVGFTTEIGAVLVAEGVEDEEQVAVLRELGVTHAQGFALGHPGNLAEATRERTGA